MDSSIAEIRTAIVEIRTLLRGAAEAVTAATVGFSGDVKTFGVACHSFQTAASEIDRAYTSGVEEVTKSLESLRRVNDEGLEMFRTLDISNNEILSNFKATTGSYEAIAKKLEAFHEAMNQSLSTSIQALGTLNGSLASVTGSSTSLLEELRSSLPDTLNALKTLTRDLGGDLQAISRDQKQVLELLESAATVMGKHEAELQRTFKKVYADHQTAMSSLYNGISTALKQSLGQLGDEAVQGLRGALPMLSQRAIDAVAGLERSFSAMVLGYEGTLQKLEELSRAIGFNEETIRSDLEIRSKFVDERLAASVGKLSDDLGKSLAASISQTSDRAFTHVKDVSAAISQKYENLIQVYAIHAVKPGLDSLPTNTPAGDGQLN